MTHTTTLQALLRAVNLIDRDRDIFVDVLGSIAVCPPIKITPAGRRHFAKALDATVIVEYKNDSHTHTYVSDACEATNLQAFDLLASLAGYCGTSDFEKWFEGEEAELI